MTDSNSEHPLVLEVASTEVLKAVAVARGGEVDSSYHTTLAFIATPAPRGSIATDLDRI
jgi:hypothetical protein